MTNIDPEQERIRLAARYAQMSDLELQKVGRDPAALTEWARSALADEMRRRGLEWKPTLPAAKPINEHDILVRLGIYADRNTAGLVRDFLVEKGIKAFFFEAESSVAEGTGATQTSGTTQLLIRAADLAMARSFIADRERAELELKQAGENSEGNRPVVFRRYRDMPRAFVEKSVVEDAGIPCYLQDDNVIRMDWLWSNAMGGIKLMVREKDLDEAERILNQIQTAPAEGEGNPST